MISGTTSPAGGATAAATAARHGGSGAAEGPLRAWLPRLLLPDDAPVRYPLAVLLGVLSFGARVAASPLLGDVQQRLITLYPGVLLSALLCGLGPGIAVTLLSAALAWFWLMPPVGSFAIPSSGDRAALLLFVVQGTFIAWVAALYRAARLRYSVAERSLALRAVEARHRAFFENLQELVVLYRALRDERGEIVDWVVHDSNARTRAYLEETYRAAGVLAPGEPIVGKRLSALTPPAGRSEEVTARWEAALEGTPASYEVERAGRTFAMTAFRTGDDLIATLAFDLTERKEAEAALRESDRRKGEFLAVLSHELRNPLGPILNGLWLLDRAPPGGEQARCARAVIERQTRHLTSLVDDLLDMTRISRGRIELRRARMDLREVVRRTCDDHRASMERDGLALALRLPGAPVPAEVDATRIAQVLGNLLQNAQKFTPAPGRVEVAVEADGGAAVIRVRDTGVGIDPHLVDQVFEPFVQAERTLARTSGGLGLGLALVKALVELHGGTVAARSGGLGRGAEFVVRLPAAPAAAPEAAPPRPAARDEAGGLEVLIVEDNPDAAETLAAVMELEGHAVRVAPDGQTGLRLARERRPDVVLCDIGLPDISGFEVAEALRADPALGGIRLVAVTGYAQPEHHRRAREAGFDALVGKPAPLDALTAAIAGEVRSGAAAG